MANTKITSRVLADDAVLTANITDANVTTAKIANANVTVAKMAANSVDSDQYVDGSIDTAHIAADQITTALIADDVALGGNPTTTTQLGSNSTTRIATTAFVQQELTTLIGGAPSTLNDLNELAAAINDDANYNSTLTTALATKLPLAGGTMTGTLAMGANNITSSGTITGTLATAAQTNITSLGTLTALTVDDITINGSTISDSGALSLTSAAFTVDATGVITLDSDAGGIYFKDGGTTIGEFINSSSDLMIKSAVQDKDILLKGNDGGSTITALTLDMSEAGAATFNSSVTALTNFNSTSGNDLRLNAGSVNRDVFLQVNGTTMMTITGSTGAISQNTAGASFAVGGSNGLVFENDNSGYTTQTIYSPYSATNTAARLNIKTGTLAFWTSSSNGSAPTEKGRIEPSGYLNLGLGSTVASERLDIVGAFRSRGNAAGATSVTDCGLFYFIPTADDSTTPRVVIRSMGTASVKGNIQFMVGTSGTQVEAMRIGTNTSNSEATLYLGTTSIWGAGGNAAMAIGGFNGNKGNGIAFKQYSSSASISPLVFYNSGAGTAGSVTYTYSSVAFNTSSDYRLKENVQDMTNATALVKQLKPKTFEWTYDPDDTTQYGFLAHEAQAVFPTAVTGVKDATKPAELDDDGNAITGTTIEPQQMDHSKLVPLLVKTIQELEARITTLEG